MGKSNLLEILAIIFTNLDLLQTESDYNDWPYDTDNFEYDISYECKGSDIRITSMEGMFKAFKKDIGAPGDLELINFGEFKKVKHESFLPDYIIGYYSGENKRIRSIIQNHEKQVLSDLKANKGLEDGFRLAKSLNSAPVTKCDSCLYLHHFLWLLVQPKITS